MKMFAFKRVRFDAIEAALKEGWIAIPPNDGHYQHLYGIIMFWVCSCPIPGERTDYFDQHVNREGLIDVQEQNPNP